jgi:hypothetical protein
MHDALHLFAPVRWVRIVPTFKVTAGAKGDYSWFALETDVASTRSAYIPQCVGYPEKVELAALAHFSQGIGPKPS